MPHHGCVASDSNPDVVNMDREHEIRRLKFLARRRSTLELDRLLGTIADCLNWEELTEADLSALAKILALDDLDLQKALLSKSPAPHGTDSMMWRKVIGLLTKNYKQ